ncbi:hypothetical protein RB601_004912 [Gaeumannomyces tritici]
MNHGLKSRGLVAARPALASAAPMMSQHAAVQNQQHQQHQQLSAFTAAPRLTSHAMAVKGPHPPGWRLWHSSNGIKFGLLQSQQCPHMLEHSLATHRALHTISSGTSWEVESVESGLLQAVNEEDPVPSDQAQSASDDPLVEGYEAAEEDFAEDEEPPATTLEYKFPPEAFREAKRAATESRESYWSYTFYRGPGGKKVKVHYCRSRATTEQVCQYFLDETILGFDLEWALDANRYSGPRRNVSLIQLASPSRIALFHVALFPPNEDVTVVAPTLRRIMEDPAITKCGVSIKADCTRLRNFLKIDSRGVFELSHLFRLVKYSRTGETNLINKRLVSLAEQTLTTLGLPLYKGIDVRWSQWWKSPLQMDQILYSASDAYAAIQIYDVLEQQRQNLHPTPPRPYHVEHDLPIRLAEPDLSTDPDEANEELVGEGEEEEAVVDEDEHVVEEEQEEEEEEEEDEFLVAEDELAVEEELEEARVEEEELVEEEDSAVEQEVAEEYELAAEQVGDGLAEPFAEEAAGFLEESSAGWEDAGLEAAQQLSAPEFEAVSHDTKPTRKTKSTKTTTKRQKEERLHDERLLAAEEWLEQYQDSLNSSTTTTTTSSTMTASTKTTTTTTTTVTTTRRPRAPKAALRAYRVWLDNPDLDPPAVAALVRDPPLQPDAVLGYILEAVRAERLPYDRGRLCAEVLDRAPPSLLSRYARLDREARACGGGGEAGEEDGYAADE